MSEWKEYKFSDFVEINPLVSLNGKKEYSYVEMKDLQDGNKFCFPNSERKPVSGARFQNGDTLFAKITPCLENGKICQVKDLKDGIGFGSTELFVFRGKQKISDSEFVFYLSRWDEVRNYAESRFEGTSGRQRVPKNCFDNLLLSLPDYSEQTAIAEVLSSLDDKIDLLNRQNKTLEQLAETLFRQWFVEEAEESWENKPFGTLIETTLGGEWGKENLEGEFTKQVCCIRGTDIADLQVGLAERTPVRFVKEKKFESVQPLDGDLILEISGGTEDQSTGRTIYINELNRTLFPYPLVFSNFCRLIRPKHKEVTYFLYLYIQYLYEQDEFFNLENGSSGIKNLDYKFLLFELTYPMPKNEKDILKFNNEVTVYFEKIDTNKQQIKTIAQLRDTLLPKLMSGEVKVKN